MKLTDEMGIFTGRQGLLVLDHQGKKGGEIQHTRGIGAKEEKNTKKRTIYEEGVAGI